MGPTSSLLRLLWPIRMTEVWVSVWARGAGDRSKGEIVVYDAETLEEKTRIKGLETPTGKFNVYNRMHHVT